MDFFHIRKWTMHLILSNTEDGNSLKVISNLLYYPPTLIVYGKCVANQIYLKQIPKKIYARKTLIVFALNA